MSYCLLAASACGVEIFAQGFYMNKKTISAINSGAFSLCYHRTDEVFGDF